MSDQEMSNQHELQETARRLANYSVDKSVVAVAKAYLEEIDKDCTEVAHPAWFRGYDYALNRICERINRILDGKDNGKGVAFEPWESVRRRLLALVKLTAIEQTLLTVSEWIEANVRNLDRDRHIWNREGAVPSTRDNLLPPSVYDQLPVDVDGDKPGPSMCTARYELGRRDAVLAEVLLRLGLARPDPVPAAPTPVPAHVEQPAPRPGTGDVWLEVIGLMHERRAVGIERYGTPLQHGNGRDAQRDLIDELLDAQAYMRQRWVQEVEELKRKHGVIA